MNLQESIRRILKEIDEDRIQIRLGRSAERHFGTVQNIIIQVDNEDITGQDGEPGLGKMNIVIKDGEIIVGDIFIPEKYRRQGIATQVYQKISDHFGLPIVNSKTKGFNQTMEGGYMWKDREKFEPRNLQESIRKVLREETNLLNTILRRIKPEKLDEEFESSLKYISKLFIKNYKSDPRQLSEQEFTRMIGIDLIQILDFRNIFPNDIEWYEDTIKTLTKHYKKRIRSMYNVLKK